MCSSRNTVLGHFLNRNSHIGLSTEKHFTSTPTLSGEAKRRYPITIAPFPSLGLSQHSQLDSSHPSKKRKKDKHKWPNKTTDCHFVLTCHAPFHCLYRVLFGNFQADHKQLKHPLGKRIDNVNIWTQFCFHFNSQFSSVFLVNQLILQWKQDAVLWLEHRVSMTSQILIMWLVVTRWLAGWGSPNPDNDVTRRISGAARRVNVVLLGSPKKEMQILWLIRNTSTPVFLPFPWRVCTPRQTPPPKRSNAPFQNLDLQWSPLNSNDFFPIE